jgi:hypothetical protein
MSLSVFDIWLELHTASTDTGVSSQPRTIRMLATASSIRHGALDGPMPRGGPDIGGFRRLRFFLRRLGPCVCLEELRLQLPDLGLELLHVLASAAGHQCQFAAWHWICGQYRSLLVARPRGLLGAMETPCPAVQGFASPRRVRVIWHGLSSFGVLAAMAICGSLPHALAAS